MSTSHPRPRLARLGVLLGASLPMALAWSASAEPPGSTVEAAPSTDVTPPRLLKQITPTFPETARASGAHGEVSVLVQVDESGAVQDVRVEQGPEVFRQAAADAARQLSFAPALRDGIPVAVTTRVFFHFAPPDEAVEVPGEEIVVHGTDPDREDTRARSTLGEEAIERAAGDDLASTVAQVPGVRMAEGTADVAKPIIRGQQERRLLVLYDGVRHESQKWGAEHATEIDPFAAGTIGVVRGAAGARYGSDAIGGVILVDPPPLRAEPGVGGKAVAAFASNGQRPYGALRLDVAPEGVPGLSMRVEGNVGVGASLRTPTYVLGNTASRTWNLGGALGYRWDGGDVRASWHHHELKAGVFYGTRLTTPDQWKDQVQADRPPTADLWSVSYDIDRPHQDVSHDVGILRSRLHGGWGTLQATYAFQLNHRQEFEQVRDSITGPQYDFTLRTHSLDAHYQHPVAELPFGTLSGGAGVQGSFQENVYRGLSLIPSYRSFGGGVFVHERLSLARVDLKVGARLDALDRAAWLQERDYEAHVRRDTLDPDMCEPRGGTFRCPSSFLAPSASLGVLAHLVPDVLDLKVDLSTASRFPNIDEQYMLGSAPSFPVYAKGDPALGVETAYGGSLTAGLRLAPVEAEVSVYGRFVDDFIYFAPELDTQGRPRFDVTIRGTWPSYAYQAVDAVFHGVDGMVQLAPHAVVGGEARGSLVRAREVSTGDQLVGTPPDHLHLALVGRPPSWGPIQRPEIRVTTDLVASQFRVDPDADFAPPPPGQALVGASAEVTVGRRLPVRVGVDITNLLDTRYRAYTSLLRYYADQPGRNVRVRVGADF